MKWLWGIILLVIIVGCTGKKDTSDNPLDREPEVIAARNWLELIDNGEYGKSWDQASMLVRDSVTRDEWIMTMTSLNHQFGKRMNRETDGVTWFTVLPGIPEGEYREIRLVSEADGKPITETLTMQNDAGTWLVAGYFIR